MQYQAISNPIASAVNASTVGSSTATSKGTPWHSLLAPLLGADMSAFYCLMLVGESISESGTVTAAPLAARIARDAARRFVASKRPRERWTFRAWPTALTDDGVPAVTTSDETDTYGVWARLLRVTDPTGDVRDCGDEAALALAEAAHKQTLAKIAEQASINAWITAQARSSGMTPGAFRGWVAEQAKARGVTVAAMRVELGYA